MCIVLILILDSALRQIVSVIGLESPSLLIFIIILVIAGQFGWWIWSNQKRDLKPVINDLEQLPDGSYAISWGYINKTGKPIYLQHKESSVVVTDGAILLLGSQPPYQFDTGEHHRVMKMVALENTIVEWIIKGKRKRVVVNTTTVNKKKGK